MLESRLTPSCHRFRVQASLFSKLAEPDKAWTTTTSTSFTTRGTSQTRDHLADQDYSADVVHDEGYISDQGVHTNQAECRWSLLQPWLAKFRGLSEQGLEQAARTYGFRRSLNLTGAPIHSLIDYIAVNVFR